jgi:hypothetical protein
MVVRLTGVGPACRKGPLADKTFLLCPIPSESLSIAGEKITLLVSFLPYADLPFPLQGSNSSLAKWYLCIYA